jgi:uncharacterized membrane protein
MRQRWSFLKTLYWSIAGLILGAILHISYVLAAPHLSGGTAWRQLSPQLPINEMKVLAPVKPGAQPLPFMAPDVRYAMCRFDLAAGPLQIRTRLLDQTWSVLLFTAQGENFSTFTSSDVQKSEIEMTVSATTEQSLLQSAQTFLTRTQKETRGPRDPGIVITAPAREGLAVIRAPLMGIAFHKEVELALASATCRPQPKNR